MISCEIPDLYKIQNRQRASGTMIRDGTRAPSWGAVTRRTLVGELPGGSGRVPLRDLGADHTAVPTVEIHQVIIHLHVRICMLRKSLKNNNNESVARKWFIEV